MLLEMKQITKKYGAFTANRDINFTLGKGEIHAILGENGAGKSTLMKILYGLEEPTSGEILLNGQPVLLPSPASAISHGIGMVHQHFMLFPSLTITENVVFGQENKNKRKVFFDRKQAEKKVKEICALYHISLDVTKKVEDCTIGEQQMVEIIKVLYQGASILILDEPTAVLTPIEVKEFLVTIKKLAGMGKSIILITHKLHEVMETADRITVLKQGEQVAQREKQGTNKEELARLMVGREIISDYSFSFTGGNKVLQVDNLSIKGPGEKRKVNQVSLSVSGGEIVGVAGVGGNGQSELVEAIAGLRTADEGSIFLNGRNITRDSVKNIRKQGLSFIHEDRNLWGAAPEESIKENAIMGHYQHLQKRRILRSGDVTNLVSSFVEQYKVKTSGLDQKAKNLSGGNLQKLIVARELKLATPLLIAAEPTRGVDIGAMEFIHKELVKKRNEGGAVLLVSSELSEILKLSDRIVVFYDGEVAGELSREEATEEKVSWLMSGGGLIEPAVMD